MKFGLATFSTDYSMPVGQLARAAEERGFESLFLTEHSHIPVCRRTPWPWGKQLPEEYSHALDPFVALSVAASATTDLIVGTGVCLVAQRDPIQLAKEVTSLDHISGGRFVFGVGAGWNIEEMENHGTRPDQRWVLLRERVAAMRRIWAETEADYHGELVDFDALWAWPKPAAAPPVLIGGDGPRVLERVLDYGDGWMPINAFPPGQLAARMQALQDMARVRDRERPPVTLFGGSSAPESLDEYAGLGLDRCLFTLRPTEAQTLLPHLDRLAAAVEQSGHARSTERPSRKSNRPPEPAAHLPNALR